ncbi:WRKY transcription factor SUSIBA2 isoform X3 [Vitis vinifera]|uniref:WRKY transcription factor SUSIBA2 isoform X3 n=1 Tax=Vitis vinifera TaxID=29760 RepID=UPI0005402D5F|nr:WRKY transcription factor SUSIBA2 isoform X3 [Vitis vinifera]|eukprot:XP_010649245.1 PREDICTED: uncharacterized protein LOC100253049 isoform X5 [Vitis vinifera]
MDGMDSTRINSGSIAERRAAKFGFDASIIKTPRFRCSRLLALPAARSPPLIIPPGISPTVLLDSPIMLPNTQAQLSPTTGTFQVPSLIHEGSVNSVAPTVDGDQANNFSASGKFKSHANPISLPCFSSIEIQVSSPSDLAQSFGAEVHYQTCAPTHSPVGFEFATEFSTEASAKNYVFDSATDVKVSNTMISDIPSDHMSQHKEPIHSENVGMHHIPEEQKGTYPSMGMGRTSEDGYNWRKYGQKSMKGSEHTRSYYKCTHLDCPMRKKVQQSHDGQITEIIYKGGHNHPKPLPSRRSALGSTLPFNEMSGLGEGGGSSVRVEGGSIWRNVQPGSKNDRAGSDWRANGLERTSSTSAVSALSNSLSNTGGISMGIFESAGTPDLSLTVASQDDGEDGATQGSISLGDDADDEGSQSKKRTVREPRVVVQVECESDVLNDGYRWRKYGQKVVKGNLHPRNYYKCTSTGCSVRRHVERASNNQKSIIATYEGKHNHEVPAARNSSHVNSSGGNLPSAAPGAQSALALHRNANAPRPEALLQDLVPHFDIKPEFSNQYIRHSMLGNFANDMKFGPSSLYSMQFPPLQNTMLYAPFGLDSNNADPHQPGSVAPVAPDFPISLPLNLPPPANLGLPGFDFNSHGNPIGQVEPYFVGQQLQENDMRFLHPKEEKKDDIGDATTSCSSSTIYH